MAKPAPRSRRDAPAARPPRGEEQRARARGRRRAVAHLVAAVALVAAITWTVGSVRQAVARREVGGGPPAVVFANRPAWMTDVVAHQIAESFRPAEAPQVFDRQALVEVNRKLSDNPWVERVRQVRRLFDAAAGDTIEVDCDFRAPVALVHAGHGDYWFVDAKGVKLPERFGAAELPQIIYADGKVNLRVVDGVSNPPPAQAGKLWPGDDLQAGLDMAARLNAVAFAEEIVRVDVTNYAGRKEARAAHVVLVTKYDTQVWWGRPWIASDAFIEVRPEQKLETMRLTVLKFGRVDANCKWVDLRSTPATGAPDRRDASAQSPTRPTATVRRAGGRRAVKGGERDAHHDRILLTPGLSVPAKTRIPSGSSESGSLRVRSGPGVDSARDSGDAVSR